MYIDYNIIMPAVDYDREGNPYFEGYLHIEADCNGPDYDYVDIPLSELKKALEKLDDDF